MNDSGRIMRISQGIEVDIEQLFPNSSSLKVRVYGNGLSRHIEDFSLTCAFLEPLQNFKEDECIIEMIPRGSSLFKVEAGLNYTEEEASGFDDLWVTATFWFWCKYSTEPVLTVHIHCVKAINLDVIETTLHRPHEVIPH